MHILKQPITDILCTMTKVSEEDVKLDKMLDVANSKGKRSMDVANGWYIASFFLGQVALTIGEDGKQNVILIMKEEYWRGL